MWLENHANYDEWFGTKDEACDDPRQCKTPRNELLIYARTCTERRRLLYPDPLGDLRDILSKANKISGFCVACRCDVVVGVSVYLPVLLRWTLRVAQ